MANKKASKITFKNIKGNIVTSNNQSGGITAHENNSKSDRKKQLFETVGFWIALVASVVTILTYLGLQPKTVTQTPFVVSNSVDHSKHSIITDTIPKRGRLIKKKNMANSEEKTPTEKPITVGNVKGDVVISQNQTGGITAHTVNITSEKFQDITSDFKIKISDNLAELVKNYPNHPTLLIQVESGDNMRNKVAIEMKGLLSQYGIGYYPKGNTFMGVMPDHSVTIILNPDNKKYIDELFSSLKLFIISDDFHFEPNESFPKDVVKFYINGKPTFDLNGTVTIN